MKKVIATETIATTTLLSDEAIMKIISERYEVGGGSKYAVFRELFTQGFKVKEVFKMLEGKKGFEKLIYQHVRNEFVRYNKQ